MNKEQSIILSQLSYLDWPPNGANTLEEFADYYLKPVNWPTDKDFDDYKNYLEAVKKDPYLKGLKKVGYQNNNDKSGFVGYAFEDTTTSSKDGVVSFRGSENPFKGNRNDWINNIEMETNPSSAQMKDAAKFMKSTTNGAGNLKNIHTTGHSLGGFHAGTQAILDPRVTSAITFNAPGVSASFMNKNKLLMTPKNLSKINAYNTTGDLVSKLGHPLVPPKMISGSFNILKAHSNDSIMKGSEIMEDLNFIDGLQELLPEKLAESLNSLASFGDGINTFMTEMLPILIETVATFFSELPAKVGEFFNQVITDIITWVSNMVITAQEEVPKFIEQVITFITELPGKIGEFFNQVVTDIITWASNMVIKAQEEVPKFITQVMTFITELPGKIGEFFNQVVTDIITWVSNMVIKAQEEVPKFIEQVMTFITELPEKISEKLGIVVTKITEWATNLKTKADEVLPTVITKIEDFFKELPSKMKTFGKDMVEGIFGGISDSVQWLYGKLKGWVTNTVDYIKGLFGINSPSKVMRDTVGIGIAEGVAVGIEENTSLVSNAMENMSDIISSSDLSVEPEVTLKDLNFEAFKEKLAPSLDFVRSQLSHVKDTLTTQFNAVAELTMARANAAMISTYNNGHTFNNSYTITTANTSPKATADAIKNQQTLTRMLLA